jgi:hypothetical protein
MAETMYHISAESARLKLVTHREWVPLEQADGGEVQEELSSRADMYPLHCSNAHRLAMSFTYSLDHLHAHP